jgi:hypothetical protein
MVSGRWLVVVDVAPSTVRDAVDRALRDLGFIEVMPCVYRNAWGEPDTGKLRAALRQAKRRGVGRVAIVRVRPSSYAEL